MHDNKSQWFIQVFCGVLTAFALFIPMPAMVFAEDEQQEYVQESGTPIFSNLTGVRTSLLVLPLE